MRPQADVTVFVTCYCCVIFIKDGAKSHICRWGRVWELWGGEGEGTLVTFSTTPAPCWSSVIRAAAGDGKQSTDRRGWGTVRFRRERLDDSFQGLDDFGECAGFHELLDPLLL